MAFVTFQRRSDQSGHLRVAKRPIKCLLHLQKKYRLRQYSRHFEIFQNHLLPNKWIYNPKSASYFPINTVIPFCHFFNFTYHILTIKQFTFQNSYLFHPNRTAGKLSKILETLPGFKRYQTTHRAWDNSLNFVIYYQDFQFEFYFSTSQFHCA